MRRVWHILVVVSLTAAAFCADQTQPVAPEKPVTPSKKELKQAKSSFDHGMKLQHSKHYDEALQEFDKAVHLAPQSPAYLMAREMLRQQLAYDHMEHGNASLQNGRQVEALADFRNALELDPENAYAQQRLHDVAGTVDDKPELTRILANSGEVHLKPNAARSDFHYRGDGRGLITQIASVYGVTATFDDSLVARPVRFDISDVDFYTAMQAACAVTKSFWTPLAEKQMLLAADTTQNHTNFDRMVLRTFYIPGLANQKDANELANLLRSLFEIRFVITQPQSGTIILRAPQQTVDAVTKFLGSLDTTRPQVMLDIRVYEISHTFMRNMGLQLPNQFKMFNIPVSALAALGGQNIQDLINQLISSGGINQANSTAISALLQQLQSQQSSIFSQPLVTFGNGLTFMGLSLGTAGFQLSTNESWVRTLEHTYLRTSHGDDALFRLGTKFPILNASFAPIFNSSAISSVLQNGSFQAPFPSFSYEDLGLSIKAKPIIGRNSNVTLGLEMQFRTLLGQSFNGIPVISNREYKGTTVLKEGESSVIVGSISRNETKSMTGIPGLGSLPGLNKITTSNNREEDDDELMMVVTPYIVDGNNTPDEASQIFIKQ